MKLKLHLGMTDLPYGRAHNGRDLGKSTYDVAKILESKYGIMAFFAQAKKTEITQEITESLSDFVDDALDALANNKQPQDLKQLWLPDTEKLFRAAIMSRFYDGKIAGVATQAALNGVNHRKKKPYKKRPARQSFFDTGMYRDNFKAWIDGE
jgi:hypothetical protein